MLQNKLALGLLALALAAPLAQAQTPPAPAAKAGAIAVDPDSIQALKDMGAYLQTLRRFEVTAQVTGEKVLEDGQKLQHDSSATLQVQRPNKLKAKMSSSRSERELIYDGKKATLYTPALKYFGSADAPDNIGAMVKELEAKFGIDVPLTDLFIWGTPQAPIDKIESAMNAGQELIAGAACDHHAFRQGRFDWQIWITAGDKPLPRKIVITNRADEARPQSVTLLSWNLKPAFKDSVFQFVAPKDAQPIKIRPLDAK